MIVIIPSRLQIFGESFQKLIDNMVYKSFTLNPEFYIPGPTSLFPAGKQASRRTTCDSAT